MSKLKDSRFQIKGVITPTAGRSQFAVTDYDADAHTEVKEFVFRSFKVQTAETYQEARSHFGPLAATDGDLPQRSQKDKRFSLNPLMRESLSVHEEEKRVIDERVRKLVTELSDVSKQEAAAQGYQDGLKKGFEEAFKQLQKEAAERVERFDLFLSEVENAKQEVFRANERFLVDLVFRIAKMLLLKDLAVDRSYVQRLVTELVNRIGVKDHITIKISPKDYQNVEVFKNDIQKLLGGMSNLNIESHSNVPEGGCEVETEWNVMSAKIDSQIETLHRSLLQDPKLVSGMGSETAGGT
jgi:flagellar biosynthesis/type III secretory pathway protein FliH